jgi:RNA-directed DNA polymerase
MTTGTILMDKWNNIPWKAAEKNVFKLQNRIYRASQRNDIKTVHKLQRLLIKSQSAKCLAVRRVTQDNQGKKTAGVDGKKSLTPQQRIAEVKGLKLDGQAAPVRRIWIPKPGKNELRGLGIPTIHDRTLQTLVKFVLEPEWEARFEPNSYGFRPARATWDAIAAIYNGVILKPKWVLDTDIEKCYDHAC